MKRKIFGFLSLALTVVVGASLMGSCKDYDEDQYNDLIHKLADQDKTLGDKLTETTQKMQAQIDSLCLEQKNCKDNCSEKFVLIQKSIDSLRAAILGVADGGETNLITIMTQMNQKAADAAANAKAADVKADSIAALIVGWPMNMNAAYQKANDAYALAVRDSIRINGLDAKTEEQQNQIDSLSQVTDSLFKVAEENLKEAKKVALEADSVLRAELLDTIDVRIAEIDSIMAYADSLLKDQIDTLSARVDSLEKRMSAAEAKIDSLCDEMSALKSAVTKMITNITVNGAINPVYGSFAWPVGLRSNMLIAYYGEFESSVEFPTQKTARLIEGCSPITATDAVMLGLSSISKTIPAGVVVSDSTDNAGKVMFTINPNTADLDGDEFTLVNSQGVESKAVFGEVVPSTQTLAFGSTDFLPTRSAVNGTSANAFYEAPVQVTADAVDALKVNVEAGLKNAVKSVLDRQRPDIAELATGIYRQFNNIFEANAIKATWTDSLGQHSVLSNYDLAVAAVKPLSYHTLAGVNLGKLPEITPLGNISFSVDGIDDLDFSTVNFNVGITPISLSFGTVSISTSGVVQVTVDVPSHVAADGTVDAYVPRTYDVDNLDQVLDDVAANLNIKFSDMEASVNSEVNGMINQIQTSINNEVQSMLSQVSGTLKDQVNDMLDDVAASVTGNLNDYIGKMNSLISKINSVSNRLNGYLSDINSKLQVVMFYEDANGTMRNMSTSKSLPAIFQGSGSIVLYPTSWTADIAVPSYQKFVAVTNVFSATSNAQAGDAACVQVLKDTNNNNEYLNTILEGGRYGITFTPAASGYTYEIVYSAVDYQGWISTRKFYVTVK